MNDIKLQLSEKTLTGITEPDIMRFCKKCQTQTPFYTHKNRKSGSCKVCSKQRNSELCSCGSVKSCRSKLCITCHQKNQSTVLCSSCHTLPKLKGKRLCKKCRHQQKGEQDTLNKFRWGLQSKYQISLESFEQMFVSQNGSCAICLDEFQTRKDICVDHDHSSGQVRQLLCQKCNSAIGYLKEDVFILYRAIEYLNRWK